jgi:hypothetical protein
MLGTERAQSPVFIRFQGFRAAPDIPLSPRSPSQQERPEEVSTMKAFGLINLGVLPLLLEAMTPAYAQHDQREQEAKRPNQQQEARPGRQQRPEERPHQPEAKHQQPETRHQQPEARHQQPEARHQQPAPQAKPAPTHAQERERGQRERQQQQQQQKAQGQQEHRQQQQKARFQQEQQQKDQQRQQQARTQQDRKPKEQPRPKPDKRPVQQAHRDYANRHGAAWSEHRAHNWQSQHRTWQDRGGYTGFRISTTSYRNHFGPRHGFRMASYPMMVVGGFPRFQFSGLWFSVIDPWPEYWSAGWYGEDDLFIESWGGGYYLLNRRHPADRIAIVVYQG